MKITVTFEIYVWFYSIYKWRKRKIQIMKSACISIELTVKPLRRLAPQDNCYTDGHILKSAISCHTPLSHSWHQ